MSFSKLLRDWYSINKRILPWRKTKDPYFVWLSEIILQQTQVKQGLPYYEKFVNQFPTVFHLAEATEEDVLKTWQGLGYYSRARNLHKTAKYVANELNGIFPNNYKELLSLKGVGDYTACAISSICFNEAHAVVDGNVYRVLARYFGVDLPINSSAGIKYFKKLAQELLDQEQPGDYNQAIMEFGATLCTPNNPDCINCPLAESCVALAKNRITNLPVKLKKTKIKNRYFNYLVLLDSANKVLLEKREGKGIWENLYQFPLIETEGPIEERDFKNLDRLKSHVSGEVNFYLYNHTDVVHKLSHQHLHTKFWIVETKNSTADSIDFSEVKKYPVPTLISNFLEEYSVEY